MTRLLFACLTAFAACSTASAELRIVGWNVESGGNDPAIIAKQLVELGRHDAYCLQEVAPSNIGRYAAAIRDAYGKTYRYIASNTGRGDRLMIVFDSGRFELMEARELFRFGDRRLNDWRHRSPLVLLLREAANGRRLTLMTVHLARGSASTREEQAAGLREWAKALKHPVIGIGDFNFDFSYRSNRGNAAFGQFTQGDVWRWVRPAEDVDTNWSDRDGDGVDNYPDSCLDFAFVAGEWPGRLTSRVVVRTGDFPDDNRTSDHRPIQLLIEP